MCIVTLKHGCPGKLNYPSCPENQSKSQISGRGHYSLADTGGVHLEEGVVHEEVKGLFLPGTPCVLVPTKAAQQLDARAVAWGVMGTADG